MNSKAALLSGAPTPELSRDPDNHERVMAGRLYPSFLGGIMGILRRGTVAIATAAIGLLVASSSASAQLLSFYTTGVFGGSGCGGTPTVCTFGGGTYSLNYTANGSSASPASYLVPGAINLGAFSVAGTGAVETISDAEFTLNIFQTVPGAGTGSFVGSVTGSFQRIGTAEANNLIWTPMASSIIVYAPPDYSTQYDIKNLQGGTHLVINGDGTTIEGYASIAPEPGTMLLLGSGLAGLFGTGRFRRRKTDSV